MAKIQKRALLEKSIFRKMTIIILDEMNNKPVPSAESQTESPTDRLNGQTLITPSH